MRQYARERLVAAGEAERIGAWHQETFLAFALEAKAGLRGPERVAWLDRLEHEHANLLAALDWRGAAGTAATDAVIRALNLVDALTSFWEARGHVTRVRPRVDALLAEEHARTGTAARVWALNGAGVLAYRESDGPAAWHRYEEMLTMARTLGDRRAIAVALHNLSNVIAQEGDQACARALLEDSVATHREMRSHWDVANGLINLGLRARDAGEPAAAESFLQDALAMARTLGDQQQIATALTGLAWIAIDRRETAAAPLAEEALALFREIGHREFAAECTATLGLCALAAGDVAGARARIVEALAALEELGHPVPLCGVLGWSALVDAAGGRPARAAQILGAAETLREQIRAPLASPEKALLRRCAATLRAILGDATFERERAVGRTYGMGQALDRALGRER